MSDEAGGDGLIQRLNQSRVIYVEPVSVPLAQSMTTGATTHKLLRIDHDESGAVRLGRAEVYGVSVNGTANDPYGPDDLFAMLLHERAHVEHVAQIRDATSTSVFRKMTDALVAFGNEKAVTPAEREDFSTFVTRILADMSEFEAYSITIEQAMNEAVASHTIAIDAAYATILTYKRLLKGLQDGYSWRLSTPAADPDENDPEVRVITFEVEGELLDAFLSFLNSAYDRIPPSAGRLLAPADPISIKELDVDSLLSGSPVALFRLYKLKP